MVSRFLALAFAVIGLAAVVHTSSELKDQAVSRKLNPLELKGSPYGEVIGMALQDPVHLIWHGGREHDDIQVQKELENDEDAVCEVCGVIHADEEEHYDKSYLEGRPWLTRMKGELLLLDKFTRFNHSPKPRVGAVREFERQEVERLLRLAYEMDPTNYGNYNAYNLFYMEGQPDDEARQRIDQLAKNTLQACESGKRVDPMDALTAASAAENLLVWVAWQPGKYEPPVMISAFHGFKDEVANFELVYNRAAQEGRMNVYTQARIQEMEQRFDLFLYTLQEYEKLVQKLPKIYRYDRVTK